VLFILFLSTFAVNRLLLIAIHYCEQDNLHTNSRLLLFFDLAMRKSSELGISGWRGAHLQLSLKALALDGDLAEGSSEKVLRSVSSTVAAVASDR
jgi:hypothetical protein